MDMAKEQEGRQRNIQARLSKAYLKTVASRSGDINIFQQNLSTKKTAISAKKS